MNNRIYLREIKYEDKDLFDGWGIFESPLLKGYNYNDMTKFEKEAWYLMRKKSLFKRTYGVFHSDYGFIGYIALKNINPLKKTGLLGLVFDPNHVSKGYGTRAMGIFLHIFFDELKMKKLFLEVNSFNHRARRLYEKMGFEYIKESKERFENQNISEEEIEENNWKDDFFFKGDRLYSKIYKMKIERQKYEQISNERPGS